MGIQAKRNYNEGEEEEEEEAKERRAEEVTDGTTGLGTGFRPEPPEFRLSGRKVKCSA